MNIGQIGPNTLAVIPDGVVVLFELDILGIDQATLWRRRKTYGI